MTVQWGSKADRKGDKLLRELRAHLLRGEAPVLVVRTNRLRPLSDRVVVTNARVLLVSRNDVARSGPKVVVDAADIAGTTAKERASVRRVKVLHPDGSDTALGDVPSGDAELLTGHIDSLASAGAPSDVMDGAGAAIAARAGGTPASFLDDAVTVGKSVSNKALRALAEHAQPGERPWLVLGGGMSGVLAAFDGWLAIVKTGAMTSMMAGSFGGARIATFQYTDITGVEYNSGILNGVIEVLTPSYNGTANRDFWRGSTQSRNADSNDPWTLSNTLPFDKLAYKQAAPHLAELRRRIAEAKRPQVSVTTPEGPVVIESLSAQLQQLGELHAQGVLTDDEFQRAKHQLLSG